MLVACALFALAASARESLVDALKSYQNLASFSATIEHQDDSGLFPGHYAQELKWTKDRHFTLKVVRKSDYEPGEGRPGLLAPDYACDGSAVTMTRIGEPPRADPVDQGPNTMPGWEVSGGLILSALMNTHVLEFLSKSPDLTFTDGKIANWQGEKVREIVMRFKAGSPATSLFLSADGRQILGLATDMNSKHGWMHYRGQRSSR